MIAHIMLYNTLSIRAPQKTKCKPRSVKERMGKLIDNAR